MPYYDYAYDCVKVLRSLWKRSRELWNDNQDAVSRMLIKQTATIFHELIDENTINMLKKGEKYKLFKFIFKHVNLKKTTFCYKHFDRILDEMPQLEIEKLIILNDKLGLINKLVTLYKFESKQDLFEILTLYSRMNSKSTNMLASDVVIENSKMMEKYEYVHNIKIPSIQKDLNLNLETNTVWI